MGVFIGIDCGSAAYKGAALINGKVAATCVVPTGWHPKQTAAQVLAQLLAQTGAVQSSAYIVATGYGRANISFADKTLTEISCHALGANYLLPGVGTVIDIGGQDSKVISVAKGKVLSFQMNDKCAAGTGRFLEMSAHRLGVDLQELQMLLQAGESCALSSMCAVFADSEIISLLAEGKSRQAVAGGIIKSVVARVSALAARTQVCEPVLLTGGLAGLEGLRAELALQLGVPVQTVPLSRYAGAIGAACKYM